MNLQQTVESLGQTVTEEYPQGVTLAIDVGVHSYCDINSNCPVAVELRKIIHETGINLQQLLEGFAATQETPPEPLVNGHQVEFDGRATIRVAGQNIQLNFDDIISQQLREVIRSKTNELDRMSASFNELGRGLYRTYLNQIAGLRTTKELSQLKFSVAELTKVGCFVTSDGSKYILYLIPLDTAHRGL